jgi:uncharacterized protein DUF4154
MARKSNKAGSPLSYSRIPSRGFVSACARLAHAWLPTAIGTTLARSLHGLCKFPRGEDPRRAPRRQARQVTAREPVSRANARDLRKISPFGRNDNCFFTAFGSLRRSGHALREINPILIAAVRRRVLRHWALCPITVAVFFVLITAAFAQVSKEYQLKAVFLWRLAQFTEWPSDAFESADSSIVICVLGENPFGDALNAAVAGETAHGRKLVVQQHRVIEQVKTCHILYISGAGPRQAKAITASLAGRSVLTARDIDGLASAYDTIIGFITEQNKIKLRINLKAATAARLVLDPRLLRAAEIVGE